ncbi:MAG: thymidine phosphorylase [Planctomycetaceae bacterium]
MLTANLIAKKRDGRSLSDDEIRFLIDGFVAGSVADYQMSAFAMAVLWRGMTAEETTSLTLAMRDSGERLTRDADSPPRVDKHSTGGLGDNVSLVLAPLLACQGVHVPMMSGRGLGHTGGTLDKLESIPGLRTDLGRDQQRRQLRDTGCFIIGASEQIAPADRKLYALRDVTATVESVALITASILSKKLSADLDALVMDVKVGSAAFMKTPADARQLAAAILSTAKLAGLPTRALLTDMDQPLCRAVGNAIEVNHALDILSGCGSTEVLELSIELGVEPLLLCRRFADAGAAASALRRSIHDGSARERFERMIASQGGALSGYLPLATEQVLTAQQSGYVAAIDCATLGRCIVEMGGGRRVASDRIDPGVGVLLGRRIGERVEIGDPLLTIYSRSDHARWRNEMAGVVTIGEQNVPPRPLVIARLEEADTKK